MAKVAIITDTHFGASKSDEWLLQKQMDFIQGTFFPSLVEHHIFDVIHMGDVFDNRQNLNTKMLDTVYSGFFTPLRDSGVNLRILLGNHDIYYKNTNRYHSLFPLPDMFDNVALLDRFDDYMIAGEPFAAFPWINNDNLEQALGHAKTSHARFAVGHTNIIGFEMQRGRLADYGLTAETFKNFELFLTGHFHLRSRKGNIVYTGNPYYLTWADYNTEKGFAILDTETGELSYIANPDDPYVCLQYEAIDHSTFDPAAYQGKILELQVKDFAVSDHAEFRVLVDELQKACYKFNVVVQSNIETVSDLSEAVKLDSNGGISAKDTILACIDGIEVQGMDKTRIKAILGNLYEGAQV